MIATYDYNGNRIREASSKYVGTAEAARLLLVSLSVLKLDRLKEPSDQRFPRAYKIMGVNKYVYMKKDIYTYLTANNRVIPKDFWYTQDYSNLSTIEIADLFCIGLRTLDSMKKRPHFPSPIKGRPANSPRYDEKLLEHFFFSLSR